MKRKLCLRRVLGVLLLLWFFLSVINVNLCNDPFGSSYGDIANWNLFNLFF